jgi:3'(2'), 5'-bisphosphate nucleotidase
MDTATASRLLEALLPIVRAAGALVMDIYRSDFAVRGKDDASPVTEADERAEGAHRPPPSRPCCPACRWWPKRPSRRAACPHSGAASGWSIPSTAPRSSSGRNGEFTVNIALVEDGEPVLGTVFAPALERLFLGAGGVGAFVEQDGRRRPIRCRTVPPAGLTVVASRSHGDAAALDAFLDGRKVAALTNAGSSLKLCLVAAGEADLYPRLGRTMEWDIAAGHAVLTAAGGRVQTLAGAPLRYGKPGLDNPHFVASGLD